MAKKANNKNGRFLGIKVENLMKILSITLITLMLSIMFILISSFFSQSMERSDWWTEVFCLREGGEYQEGYFYDICSINGVEHRAKFEGTGEYYNLTRRGEIYEWQLVPLANWDNITKANALSFIGAGVGILTMVGLFYCAYLMIFKGQKQKESKG